jgi:hypothetical protein
MIIELVNGKYLTNGKEYKDLNELERQDLNNYFIQIKYEKEQELYLKQLEQQESINNILVFDVLELIEN